MQCAQLDCCGGQLFWPFELLAAFWIPFPFLKACCGRAAKRNFGKVERGSALERPNSILVVEAFSHASTRLVSTARRITYHSDQMSSRPANWSKKTALCTA